MSLLLEYLKTFSSPNQHCVYDNKFYTKGQLIIDCELLTDNLFSDSEKNIYALFLPRSYIFIVSVLASLNSEHVFLPLDNEQPYQRTLEILLDSKAKYIIALKDEPTLFDGYTIKLTLSLNGEQINLWQKKEPNIVNIDNEAAYLIYSSGSTGKPKGILLKEKGVFEVIKEQIVITKITSHDKFAWCLNTAFDASLSDIFVSLISGATLFVFPYKLNQIKLFVQFFNEYNITYSDLPPSLLKILKPHALPSLKGIIFGGEVCPEEILKKWSVQSLLINAYGPTETTICSSMSIYSSNWTEGEIGVPLKGVEYFIQNDSGIHPILIGNKELTIEGMLLIAGEHLAINYYYNDFLNKKHFIYINEQRFYKTFDLVRFEQGKIIYLGREDRQMKVNGILICPEEIENYLYNHNYEVVVGLNKEKKLSLWYTDRHGLEKIKS